MHRRSRGDLDAASDDRKGVSEKADFPAKKASSFIARHPDNASTTPGALEMISKRQPTLTKLSG